ncbi:MAG: helix-turn-helix domain-containing protein [Candidatus Eremiobacteraeota bacterium]|nr:helix-turn-helix domain-containing protein [Candidatus Eremiobacteraeota bacterium]
MQVDRFFQSTRGKIVAELRSRRSASAADLASAFGLSPNAIRQQLVILERDGLVEERSVRRGPTKPTHEFSLTADGEKLFPQHYDKMLGAVLREIREQNGSDAVGKIFAGIAERINAKNRERFNGKDAEGRLAEITTLLRSNGVDAEYSLIDGRYALREHNCPYGDIPKEHPEVCSVIHHVLDATVGEHVQTESLATGGSECRFEVKTATPIRGN